MIGQKKLLQKFRGLLEEHRFPLFTVLVGPPGSGKKTLIHELFPDAIYMEDNKIESVRKLVEMANKYRSRIFVLPDADTLSTPAKNALLKVAEECPNDNHFIMTLEDINNSLGTIRSRAVIFYMEPYSYKEISDYYDLVSNNVEESNIVKQLCETPGQVNTLIQNGGLALVDYAKLVLENVAVVSTANALKIGSKIALKSGETGFDLALFFKSFQMQCIIKVQNTSDPRYMFACQRTTKYLIDAKKPTLNKTMIFDSWVLDMRDLLRDE